jgi:serine/threonine protein phosphatase PrpC
MHGHFVSGATKQFLEDYYNNGFMYSSKYLDYKDKVLEILRDNNYQLIKESFSDCEELLSESQFEVNFSGTTCVILLIIGQKIIVANAGDSRAVMVFENQSRIVLR